MHKLTDMKVTKAEREKNAEKYKQMAVGPYDGGEDYPYELRLRLGNRELEKLGIDKLPATKRKVRIMAEGVVTSTNESATARKGEDSTHRSLEVQLQKISLNLEATSAEEAMNDALEE